MSEGTTITGDVGSSSSNNDQKKRSEIADIEEKLASSKIERDKGNEFFKEGKIIEGWLINFL